MSAETESLDPAVHDYVIFNRHTAVHFGVKASALNQVRDCVVFLDANGEMIGSVQLGEVLVIKKNAINTTE